MIGLEKQIGVIDGTEIVFDPLSGFRKPAKQNWRNRN
jgi:hypothetical protein